jgi:NADH-quinone oxidoreductase subunit G
MEIGVGQSRNDRVGTPFDRWHDESNKVDCLPGWVSLPEVAARLGHPLAYRSPAALMKELAGTPAFSGATHDAMDLLGVPLEDVPATA